MFFFERMENVENFAGNGTRFANKFFKRIGESGVHFRNQRVKGSNWCYFENHCVIGTSWCSCTYWGESTSKQKDLYPLLPSYPSLKKLLRFLFQLYLHHVMTRRTVILATVLLIPNCFYLTYPHIVFLPAINNFFLPGMHGPWLLWLRIRQDLFFWICLQLCQCRSHRFFAEFRTDLRWNWNMEVYNAVCCNASNHEDTESCSTIDTLWLNGFTSSPSTFTPDT